MLRSLGNPVPGEGRKHGGWSRRPLTVIGLIQTGSPPQNSAVSNPCSSQINLTTFPSSSLSSQFSPVQKVLVPPMPTCLSSLSPTGTAVPRGPHPLLQPHPSSPVLPMLWFPVATYLLTFSALDTLLPPLCSLLWSTHLSQLQKALLGSLSSQWTSASRVVIPAGELWRGRGVCSQATHSLACAQYGWKPRCI